MSSALPSVPTNTAPTTHIIPVTGIIDHTSLHPSNIKVMSFLTTLFQKEQHTLLPRSEMEIAILSTSLRFGFDGPEYDLPLPELFEKLLEDDNTRDTYYLNIAYALEEVYNATINTGNEQMLSSLSPLCDQYLFPVLSRMRQAAKYMRIEVPDINTFYTKVFAIVNSTHDRNEEFVFRLLFSNERIPVVLSELHCGRKRRRISE